MSVNVDKKTMHVYSILIKKHVIWRYKKRMSFVSHENPLRAVYIRTMLNVFINSGIL